MSILLGGGGELALGGVLGMRTTFDVYVAQHCLSEIFIKCQFVH